MAGTGQTKPWSRTLLETQSIFCEHVKVYAEVTQNVIVQTDSNGDEHIREANAGNSEPARNNARSPEKVKFASAVSIKDNSKPEDYDEPLEMSLLQVRPDETMIGVFGKALLIGYHNEQLRKLACSFFIAFHVRTAF